MKNRRFTMIKTIDRPRAIEKGQPGPTEMLANWINKVHYKKKKCYRSPKHDYCVQAVLTYAMHKAQYELWSKQLARRMRWHQLKKELLKDVTYGSCALYHAAEAEREKERLRMKEIAAKKKEACEVELQSLCDFFQQIGEIKTFVQR